MRRLIICAAVVLCYVQQVEAGSDHPDIADLIYCQETGGVLLDVTATGELLTAFALETTYPGGVGFNAPGVVNLPDTFGSTDSPRVIAGMFPFGRPGWGSSPTWNLGPICPTGMDEDALDDFFTMHSYTLFGTGGFSDFDLLWVATPIPEPSTLILLFMSAVGLLAWRIRK